MFYYKEADEKSAGLADGLETGKGHLKTRDDQTWSTSKLKQSIAMDVVLDVRVLLHRNASSE